MQQLIDLQLPVYTYGILMLVAFLAGTWLFSANCRATGIKKPDLVDFMLIISLAGLAGARIMYIALFPQQFSSFRDLIALHEGGLVFHGGLFASAAGLFVYFLKKSLPWRALFDAVTPSLALGHAIGRFGCLINGCCYGARTDLISIYHLSGDPPGCYRHPTQAYEGGFLLLLAVFTAVLLRRRPGVVSARPGVLTGLYVFVYSIWRFLLEFIRDDDRGGFFTPILLSPGQLASIFLMTLAGLMVIYCYKYPADTGDKADEQN